MTAVARIVRVAIADIGTSLRSRRAIVMILLFAAVSALIAYALVSAFAAIEREVVAALGLPAADNPCAVSATLWKSKPFMRFASGVAGGNLVFADIIGRHPLVLAYAFFMFSTVAVLTLLVSAPKIADEIRSGAARYWLIRTTRGEWSIGKFVGEALLVAVSLSVGSLSAWGVVAFRLPGATGAVLLPDFLDWTARAAVYAFAWLGLFIGISHVARSGGKAVAFSILAMIALSVWPITLGNIAEACPYLSFVKGLDVLAPHSAMSLMWRRTPAALLRGVVHLSAISFLYVGIGAALFRRRDV